MRGVDRVRADELVGLVLLVGIELQVWVGSSVRDRVPLALVGVVLSVAVAVRRRWPLAGMLVTVAALTALTALGGHMQNAAVGLVAMILIFYGSGAFLSERRSRLALGVAIVVSAIGNVTKAGSTLSGLLFLEVFVVLLPWALGRMLRERAARERAYRETAERLDAGREQRARVAGFGERTRIARELHDMIAHSVSLMVVQAGGARLMMGSEPERAEASLGRVQLAGREALAEMRRLLAVLDSDKDRWAPGPGLADVGDLLASTRACGLATALRVDGDPSMLSPALDLSAYRIIQEALTNAIKHAGATHAEIRVRWREDALELEISDDGRGPVAANGVWDGHGIAGMRERATLHGGSIHAGVGRGGGFAVRARLPLAPKDRATSGLRERVAGLDRTRVDAIFAVAVIIELELECWLNRGIPDSHRLATAVAAVFFAAPIAVRRYAPSFALLFCLAVVEIQTPLSGFLLEGSLTGDLVPVLILAYSAGAWLDLRPGVLTLVLGIGLLSSSALLADGGATGVGNAASGLFWISLMILPAWFVGRLVRERHRRATAFRELAALAAAEQEKRESAAITEERARIGGELRDIIAHSVSAMMIQAGAAGRLLCSEPDRARDSILNVEQTGREALADLRRLLGMLRDDDDPRALAPQPGLGQLASLVRSLREVGVECELRTLGERIDLTPGVDLVGYRVIEAALLTAADHHASRAVVTVRYQEYELELEIRGDSTIPDLDELLRGMSERVALYDGSLRALRAGNGFAVLARLPLGAAVPA